MLGVNFFTSKRDQTHNLPSRISFHPKVPSFKSLLEYNHMNHTTPCGSVKDQNYVNKLKSVKVKTINRINYNTIKRNGRVKGKLYRGGFGNGGANAGRVKRSGFRLVLKLGLIWIGIIRILRIVSVVLLIRCIGLIVGLDLDLRRIVPIRMLLRLLLIVVPWIIHRCQCAILCVRVCVWKKKN